MKIGGLFIAAILLVLLLNVTWVVGDQEDESDVGVGVDQPSPKNELNLSYSQEKEVNPDEKLGIPECLMEGEEELRWSWNASILLVKKMVFGTVFLLGGIALLWAMLRVVRALGLPSIKDFFIYTFISALILSILQFFAYIYEDPSFSKIASFFYGS